MSEITPVDAAIWYAEHGIAVFPCRPRNKMPITDHGFYDASTDPAIIREYWHDEPLANIGVPTGKPSGWLVVDVDPRNGGDATFTSWLEQYGRYPDTAEAITGSGGRHVVFHHVDGLRCGQIGSGVDLKTDGGYVIVAPSIHPSGGQYQWDGIRGVESVLSLAEAPGWLLRRAGKRVKPKEAAEPRASRIPSGRRNEELASIAGTLRARGLEAGEIYLALVSINKRRCDPPLPDAEVRRIANSIARYQPREDSFCPPDRPIDTGAAGNPSEALVLLNALPFWQRRFRWAAFRRRGNTLVGITDAGEQARFEVDKLLRFAHAQSDILTALSVVIPSPRRGRIGETWSVAAELMMHAAAADAIDVGSPEDDLRSDMARCWRAAGSPKIEQLALFDLLASLAHYKREPHAERAPAAVFLLDQKAHCHLAVFREWLSTPIGGARYRTLPELREAAALLGFHSARLDVENHVSRQQATVWIGPASVLEEE